MGDQMATWRTPLYIVKQAEVLQQVTIKWGKFGLEYFNIFNSLRLSGSLSQDYNYVNQLTGKLFACNAGCF